MRGINYGHHWTPVTYSDRVARQEMEDILACGFSVIRIEYPTYNASVASMNMCKAMVLLALSQPFEKVIWGVVGFRSPVTATNHELHKTYIKSVAAPWCQSVGDSRLRFSVGNEEELALNTTTMSVEEMIASLKQLIIDVRAIYTVGTVDYVTASTYQTGWYNIGLPAGAKLGMNCYYEWGPFGTFRISVDSMVTRFGSNAYIAECNTEAGYPDADLYGEGSAEENWAANLLLRREILESRLPADSPHILFCYRDGSFGVAANVFGMFKTDAVPRLAWQVLTGQKRHQARDYRPRSYSS